MHHRIYHWGEFALNVNGPLMILTQKMTQLAFAVKDGELRVRSARAYRILDSTDTVARTTLKARVRTLTRCRPTSRKNLRD